MEIFQGCRDEVGACPVCGGGISYYLKDSSARAIEAGIPTEDGCFIVDWCCHCGAEGEAVFKFDRHTNIELPEE